MHEEFWLRPDTNTQPALTDEVLAHVERALGVLLPEDLVEKLRCQNGGVPRNNCHPLPVRSKWVKVVDFPYMHGAARKSASRTSLIDSPSLVTEWDLPERSVLLCGDGHWWVFLNYDQVGRGGRPSVAYADEAFLSERRSEKYVQIASDWTTFVSQLFDGRRDYAYGITAPGENVSKTAESLAQALGINLKKYEPTEESGRQSRLRFLGTTKRWRPWFRSDKSRFEFTTNKDGQGYADYPDQSDCTWILECDIHRNHEKEVFAALESTGLSWQRVHVPPWVKLGEA